MTESTQAASAAAAKEAAQRARAPRKDARKQRPTRRKLADRYKLKADPREGYKSVWVIDRDDGQNIQGRLEAGWEFRAGQDDNHAHQGIASPSQYGNVVARAAGQGEVAYLMDYPEEWAQEDAAAREDELKAKEASIMRESKQDAWYGHISIGPTNPAQP